MRISTLPVYSKLADDQDFPPELHANLPVGLRLSVHQVKTYQALKDRDVDVVINTAMTGDGKSLAGILPTLIEERPRPLFAMYPTNELIRDQMDQVKRALDVWRRQDLRLTLVNARSLDELEETSEFSRKEALLSRWRNYELVLTNPDILHYVMQQYYLRTGTHGEAPDQVVGQLLQLFDQFTFDEFHIFQAPEIVSVVNALIFIHEVTRHRPKKFLFLSATPEPLLSRYLERAGLRSVQIAGHYTHAFENPDSSQWRRILHGSTISFAPQRAEEWVEQHLEDTLLKFFRAHGPAAKGAIIVNSVASAQRLVARLRDAFASHQLLVEANTGFDALSHRRASYDADLLVGTSTVDVGVDFKINFLVFESRDAGTFLQRLGRLGRHDGFTARDGMTHQFRAFEVHALVPQWIHERLFQAEVGSVPPLTDGAEIDRERLSQMIREVFPSVATFERYGQVWGGVQAAQIIRGLYNPTIRAQYTRTREQLAARYAKTLKVSMPRELARFQELKKTTPSILEEARSFRGGGDLLCGVIDEQESREARVKKYDLFGLLANFQLGPLEKSEFFDEVTRWDLPSRAYKEGELCGYFRVRHVQSERTDVRVIFNQDIDDWGPEKFGKVLVVNHIEIHAPGTPGLNPLNSRLSRRDFVVLLCLLHPAELMKRLGLPRPFPLHRFCSRDNSEGSIAFGRQALLLEVALQARPDIKCGGERKSIIV